MRTMGPFVPGRRRARLLAVLGRRGPRAGAASPATCATPKGKELFKRLVATADVAVRELPARAPWSAGASAPTTCPTTSSTCGSACSGRAGPTAPRPGLDRLGIAFGGLLHLTGDPDRPPVRPGVTISDYLTGVFAAFAAVAALYGRDAGGDGDGERRGHRRPAVRIDPAHPRMDAGRLRPARASSASARATGCRTRPPSTTTRPPTGSSSASSPARTPTSPACAPPWAGPTWPTTRASPRWPSGPPRGDEINGIVAEWTAA